MGLKFQTLWNEMHRYTKPSRISERAVKRAMELVNNYIEVLATSAAQFARHGKRVTIQEKDVMLAAKIGGLDANTIRADVPGKETEEEDNTG